MRVADWRYAGYPWGADAGVMSDRMNCRNADFLARVDSEPAFRLVLGAFREGQFIPHRTVRRCVGHARYDKGF